MYENSTEMKIWRSVSPILLYLFINMLVQVGFTMVVTMTEFYALNDGGMMNYFVTYNFSSDIERVVNENGLAVTLISGMITIPVMIRLMKKDFDSIHYMPFREHIRNISIHRWYYILVIGALASMGISKLVTVFPIDNILGSYQEVESAFAANPLCLQILALVFIGPCTEEFIFRGLVYNRIKRYTDSMTAVYISAVMFGIYHFNLIQGLYGFALGILLCYVYEKYYTIAAPVIMHIAANLVALLMSYSGVSTVINENIYLKILVMLIEIGLLLVVLWKTNSIENIGRKHDLEERGKEV